jgi:hypothetical protein
MNGLHILVQQGKVLYLVVPFHVQCDQFIDHLIRVFPIHLPGSCPIRS